MSKEARKGATFEQDVADYMAARLGKKDIERRVKNGANDRGDITGLMMRGKRVVVECKNHAKMALSEWLDEAEVERGNDSAEFGIVVHKRKGRGAKRFGENYVTMTLDTYLAMTAGSRWLLMFDEEERRNSRLMARERGIDEWG